MQFFIVGLNTQKKTSPARRNVHWLVRYQWKSVLDDACQSGNSNFKVTCNLDNPWSTLIPSCTSTETRKRGKWDDTVNPLTWGESPLAFRKELWPPDLSFWDDRGALRLFPGHRTNRQVPLRPGRVRTGYTPVNPSHQFCQERDSRMTGQRHLKNLPRFDFIPWRWWHTLQHTTHYIPHCTPYLLYTDCTYGDTLQNTEHYMSHCIHCTSCNQPQI